MIAEESTSWPQVSRPTWSGGLGFDIKWNMGWMNDTLEYMSHDPIYRRYHQEMLTFSMLYAFTENFLLPFSHDEVTHGKQSMLNKMPGDEWQRFANLRALYTYMFCHPGKKLLFMGTEFGQGVEWSSTGTLDWYVLDYPLHQGVLRLVTDLNRLYRQTPALFRYEFDWRGFDWIDCHDADNSVLSFLRRNDDEFVIVVINLTPTAASWLPYRRAGTRRVSRRSSTRTLNSTAAAIWAMAAGQAAGRRAALDEPALFAQSYPAAAGGSLSVLQ